MNNQQKTAMNTFKTHILFLTLAFLCLQISLFAQISNGGNPPTVSDSVKTLIMWNNINSYSLPFISNQTEKNIINQDTKYRNEKIYGRNIHDNIDVLALASSIILNDSIIVFLLKIESDSAIGMQFFFNEFYLPDGAELFFYDENRVNTIGAFTYRNNRENRKFGTRPIFGDKVYIEIKVPCKLTIDTRLSISRIVHIFDTKPFGGLNEGDFTGDHLIPSNPSWCQKSVACLEEENIGGWNHEVKSVVMILINCDPLYEGLCTGTLLNVAGGYSSSESPYLLTCSHSILPDDPDPYADVEDWVFLFGFEDSDCGIFNTNTQWLAPNNSVYGAELLEYEEQYEHEYEVDYLLCRLFEDTYTINNNLDVAYAGWDKSFDDPDLTPMVLNIHHPASVSKMFCFSTNLSETDVIWDTDPDCPYYLYVNGNDFWEVVWDIGIVEEGSSGSPLFNSSHKIIGILNSTGNSCTYATSDCGVTGPFEPSAFGKFSTAWIMGDFAYYLDPYIMNVNSVETFTPNYCGNGICEPENGEVFPDCADCPDPNWNGGGGSSICWLPVSEGFKINDSDDDVVFLCSDFEDIILTSPDDNCLLRIGSDIIESNNSHCESSDWPSCWWTGMLLWKKCNCWYWKYFISVTECDYLLNPIGEEYSGWFNILQNTQVLLELPVLSDINSLGISLQQGKYYKLKLATSPWGSGWTEGTEHFYVLPENDEINGEIESGIYTVEENLIIVDGVVEVNQNVSMTAGNSITILPNSMILYGSDYLAKIDPEISSNCEVTQTSNITYKSHLNSSGQEKSFLSETKYNVPAKNGEIQIYPNPSNGFVNICLSELVGDIAIDVRDINGKVGFVEKWKYSGNIILDLSPYPKGIYLLTITTNDKVFTEKIILQ